MYIRVCTHIYIYREREIRMHTYKSVHVCVHAHMLYLIECINVYVWRPDVESINTHPLLCRMRTPARLLHMPDCTADLWTTVYIYIPSGTRIDADIQAYNEVFNVGNASHRGASPSVGNMASVAYSLDYLHLCD